MLHNLAVPEEKVDSGTGTYREVVLFRRLFLASYRVHTSYTLRYFFVERFASFAVASYTVKK